MTPQPGIGRRIADTLVRRDPVKYGNLREDLISARMGITVRAYLQRALLISLCAALFCGVVAFVLSDITVLPVEGGVAGLLPFSLPDVGSETPFWSLLRVLAITAGALAGGMLAYSLLLRYPSVEKGNRATKINLSLHNAVSYIYAMRRGGAEVMDIFRSLSENAGIYGESALEFRQVVRDTDYFGSDVFTAIRHLAETTPSVKLKEFLENFLSVVESGGNLATYLEKQVRLFQDGARFEQKRFITTLEFVGEAYVTVFVAGPLFLVIVMVVMGLIGGSAVTQLSLITYLLIPVGSLIMLLFIDLISVREDVPERYTHVKVLDHFKDVRVEGKEGEEPLFAQLARYDRVRSLRTFLRNPFRAFILDARLTFLFSLPLALLYLGAVVLSLPADLPAETLIALVDDHVVIALLVVLVPYAVFHGLWNRKVREIEDSIPEFLSRMAGMNQVGLTLAQAIVVLVRTNLGVLSYEVRRIGRDITWGANVPDALVRFEKRVRTPAVSRAVTLITTATRMSGNISDILTIAAKDARMSAVLREERSSAMILYLAVIYLAFFVFIFVVIVIATRFLPVLGDVVASTGGGMDGVMPGFTSVSLLPFGRLLYHVCLVQAVFSGLVAGKMGEGSVRAGVKHASVMLVVALITFNMLV
ncbi:type II secretion system F family protein [uncultured Methanofollis sp.]|uniref:type II secretion system F family protein n=1 Tax=uncultured Methanofollis sp. TaxID=262500 RepID=UPI002626D10B|nr:type II secretion system F family protein [uncultured Methanofollis sp.]